jgi:hypothetical protein
VISWILVATFGAVMFLWMYRNLRKIPDMQKSRSGKVVLRSPSRQVPPSSSINS